MARASRGTTEHKAGPAKSAASRGSDKVALKDAPAKGRRQAAPEPVEEEPSRFLDDRLHRDVTGVAIALVAVVLFILAVTSPSAVVSSALSSWLHQGLGLGAYVLPVVLLAISVCLLFMPEGGQSTFSVTIGLSVLLLAFLVIMAVLTPGAEADPNLVFDPEALVSRGGYVGAGLAWCLLKLMGVAISVVLMVGFALIGLIFAGWSVSGTIARAKEKSLAAAARRAEIRAAREEQYSLGLDSQSFTPRVHRSGVSRSFGSRGSLGDGAGQSGAEQPVSDQGYADRRAAAAAPTVSLGSSSAPGPRRDAYASDVETSRPAGSYVSSSSSDEGGRGGNPSMGSGYEGLSDQGGQGEASGLFGRFKTSGEPIKHESRRARRAKADSFAVPPEAPLPQEPAFLGGSNASGAETATGMAGVAAGVAATGMAGVAAGVAAAGAAGAAGVAADAAGVAAAGAATSGAAEAAAVSVTGPRRTSNYQVPRDMSRPVRASQPLSARFSSEPASHAGGPRPSRVDTYWPSDYAYSPDADVPQQRESFVSPQVNAVENGFAQIVEESYSPSEAQPSASRATLALSADPVVAETRKSRMRASAAKTVVLPWEDDPQAESHPQAESQFQTESQSQTEPQAEQGFAQMRQTDLRSQQAQSPAEQEAPQLASTAYPMTRCLGAQEADRTLRPAVALQSQTKTQVVSSVVDFGDGEEKGGFILPSMSLIKRTERATQADEEVLRETAEDLQGTMEDFGIMATVVGWVAGPTVTLFKVELPSGVRVSRLMALRDDIALALAAPGVRIFAPIPGTTYVGIEVPNKERQMVFLGDVLKDIKGAPLFMAIGKDVEGNSIVADLAKMPHLLIGGTTGSGKSVAINSMIMTILMRTTPDECRFIMIDPKRVEFTPYNGIPHLYVPVVTECKEAAAALAWGVAEMERRLKVLSKNGVRNISEYNAKVDKGQCEGDGPEGKKMPYIVIVIDELADLMMNVGKEVELSISRIAQLARAAGIHLIVATQRPSANIVTGLIKANITNRIALSVASSIDSRVILDTPGAENLIGHGDMLFAKPEYSKPVRLQGCCVSNEEIFAVVEHLKAQGEPEYHTEILNMNVMTIGSTNPDGSGGSCSADDPLIWEAADIVVSSGLGSTSNIQRRLSVGYARAGRIMDMLEEKGVVGPPNGSKPRDVLVDAVELEALKAFESQDGFDY